LAREKWEQEEGKSFRLRTIKKEDEIIDQDQFKRVSDVLKIHLHEKNPPVRDIYAIDCPHLVSEKTLLLLIIFLLFFFSIFLT